MVNSFPGTQCNSFLKMVNGFSRNIVQLFNHIIYVVMVNVFLPRKQCMWEKGKDFLKRCKNSKNITLLQMKS